MIPITNQTHQNLGFVAAMHHITANALSFDLEHWHTATLLRDAVADPVDHLVDSTNIVLEHLDNHDVTATFFVVGEVAREYPDLIAEVAAAGHEIGSHGHSHRPLFDLSPGVFERELRDSREAIVDACGVSPTGFRAPNFSVTQETAWAFDVLRESAYEYDSSVFPMKTPMYGVHGAPRRPYTVDPADPFAADAADDRDVAPDDLVELPLSVLGSTLRFPIAGGFYARVTPRQILQHAIARLERTGIPANLYFHPWEFNPAVRTDEPPLLARLISFTGIDRLGDTLDAMLERFQFGPVRDLCGGAFDADPDSLSDSPNNIWT